MSSREELSRDCAAQSVLNFDKSARAVASYWIAYFRREAEALVECATCPEHIESSYTREQLTEALERYGLVSTGDMETDSKTLSAYLKSHSDSKPRSG